MIAPQYNVGAEDGLIGSLLVNTTLIDCPSICRLKSSEFSPENRRIFQAMKQIKSSGESEFNPAQIAAVASLGPNGVDTTLADNIKCRLADILVGPFLSKQHEGYATQIRKASETSAAVGHMVNGNINAAKSILETITLNLGDHTETAKDGGQLDLLACAKSGEEPGPVPYALADSTGISPFVLGDIVVVSGEGESGKSSLCLGLALAFTTGTPFAERFHVTEPQPVLYLDGENNDRLIRRRWLRLLNGHPAAREAVLGWKSNRLVYRWRGNLTIDTQEGRDHVVELCQKHGSKVLMLDTQIRFTNGDLCSAQDASSVYAALSEIRDRAGLNLVVMLAHLRKRGGGPNAVNDPGQRLYGSVDIRNSCDTHLPLTANKDSNKQVESVSVLHDKTRWDFHYPSFKVELRKNGDSECFVSGSGMESVPNTVNESIESSLHEGRLRTDIVAAVQAKFPNMTAAAVQKAVTRELSSASYQSKPEGHGRRYWLRIYAPENAE